MATLVTGASADVVDGSPADATAGSDSAKAIESQILMDFMCAARRWASSLGSLEHNVAGIHHPHRAVGIQRRRIAPLDIQPQADHPVGIPRQLLDMAIQRGEHTAPPVPGW